MLELLNPSVPEIKRVNLQASTGHILDKVRVVLPLLLAKFWGEVTLFPPSLGCNSLIMKSLNIIGTNTIYQWSFKFQEFQTKVLIFSK